MTGTLKSLTKKLTLQAIFISMGAREIKILRRKYEIEDDVNWIVGPCTFSL
jgi:hypothetical protein